MTEQEITTLIEKVNNETSSPEEELLLLQTLNQQVEKITQKIKIETK